MDAVLPTGTRSVVFVDKGSGKLEPRFIRVGRSFTQADANGEASYDEVLDGLSEGERVVSSANFLIDAESRIQGALKTWDEESGAKEGSEKSKSESQPPPVSQKTVPALGAILGAYHGIHQLLADDQVNGVAGRAVTLRSSIRELIASTPEFMKEEAYRSALTKVRRSAEGFDARNLEDAREQFGFLSADLIAFLKRCAMPMDHPLYIVTCSMWKESPAQWVQATPKVRNPFLGSQMPECGQIDGQLQALR